jgi:cell division protein FtsB
MAKEKERSKESESGEEEMTEAQRLTLLEKAMSMNRVFLVLLALLLIVSLSVTITLALLSAFSDNDVSAATAAELDALKQQIAQLQQDNKTLSTQVAAMSTDLPKLSAAVANSSAPAFQRVLIQQEESYQEFLRAMKEGMYDLARMIPGSRTWLELYNEKMDRTLQMSQTRQRDLARLKTGEPLIEP